MKIAYLAHWNVGTESGVLKKIATQARVWSCDCAQVHLFALSETANIWEGARDLMVTVVPRGAARERLARMDQLIRRVVAWQPDLAYVRFDKYYPAFERIIGRIPICLELNTDDVVEHKVGHSTIAYLYHRITRARLLSRAQAIVAVTHELAARNARYHKPTFVSANSIDLSEFSPFPAPQNSAPRVLFLGSPGHAWHGVDKILWLARRLSDWQFDLIGVQPIDCGSELPPNVETYGSMSWRDYEAIAVQADVALGSLALHRKQMDEACPLKVREYLAFGIPTITGYRDTDFPEPVPFLLQLPNTPDNIAANVPAIQQFVAMWKGKRVPREQIAHLDVYRKEKEKLAFLQGVLEQSK